MDDKSFNIRVPKRWVRVAMIVGVTALIVAPLTAIASHSFTDVPDSNTFHSDIEWMKDSGVTKGCNPPSNTQYCPDDNVTRGQMAAFMNRFAGYIGATDGTPAQADNADTVDGKHADAFVEEGEANTISTGMVQDGAVTAAKTTDEPGVAQTIDAFSAIPTSPGTLVTVTLSAPQDGWALVTFDSDVQISHTSGTTSVSEVGISATADSFSADEDKDFQVPSGNATGIYLTTLSMTKVYPVTAGANTFYLVGDQTGGTGSIFDTHLTATYVASAYGTVESTVATQADDPSENPEN